MDQRIEILPGRRSRARGRRPGRGPGGGAGRPRQGRGDLPAAGAEEADEGPSGSRALCRARVAKEMQRRKGTRIGEHLKLVLSIIDRQVR